MTDHSQGGTNSPCAVTLAVINYNGAAFLPSLLESLARQTYRDFETCLYDNGSADHSCRMVREEFPWVRVLSLGRNLGFAAAANLAARESTCDRIAFLNTDLVADPAWLVNLVSRLDSAPDVAAVSPKMRLADRPHLLNGIGGGMNRLGYTWDRGMFEEDRGQYDAPAEVIFASAAAALFRRNIFLDLGGFDERFFMYHEDVDFGWRCWILGYRILTEPAAVVDHHFGGSTRAHRDLMWREVLGERNNIRSLLKNYESRNAIRAVWRILSLRQRWPRKLAQLRNLAWNLYVLPDTLGHRRQVQNRRKRSDRELQRLILPTNHVPVEL